MLRYCKLDVCWSLSHGISADIEGFPGIRFDPHIAMNYFSAVNQLIVFFGTMIEISRLLLQVNTW